MMIEAFRQTGYKREAVELTAETLVAAQYGTVWEGAAITEEMETNERRPDRATFAPLQSVGGAYFGKFSGAFEPRPSGTDATAPDWFQLGTASGASIASDVLTWGAEAVSVAGIIGDTVTMKVRDGVYERTLAGSRMSKLSFKAEKGGVWSCECEGTGRYTEAAQAAFLAAAHPTSGLGQPFLGLGCSIGGSTSAVSSVEISIENEVTPVADGTHASGHGRNIITGQKLMCRVTILEDGTINWRDKARNDASGDLMAVSIVMATGTAGNVLTWTGSINLVNKPTVTYVDGIGYVSIEGEFVTTSAAAALTLTQS
jgi:hypothetical protein